MLPCVLFEDEHLLVANKPAGLNTHAPSLFAGEGIYDWLKHRQPRWATLAIIHRLDKETSGVMVFGKTPLANRSLTEQFTRHTVRKKYLLLSDRAPNRDTFTAKSKITRAGERYVSSARGEPAETRFQIRNPKSEIRNPNELPHVDCYEVVAEPLTGRTHQIRVHAAENGCPVLGDTLYGGTEAARVYLHAAELTLKHPASGDRMTFQAAADFEAQPRLALRNALIDANETNACRLIHGAADGWPGWYVDRLGDFLLSQSERELTDAQRHHLETLPAATGVYHKLLNRQVRRANLNEAAPPLVLGETAPEWFTIRENDVTFGLSFSGGYSVGLFLDQRDNRRRLLTGHVAADFELPNGNRPLEILNCFAYTCGFSVCAAMAGARTTSLDLSKKYLEWGKRNFILNGLDPVAHDFIYGDAFDWLRRLAKKGRAFGVVALDPPTFSQSKEHGVFRAEKDYGKLVETALPLLKPGGVLFASTNAADWKPEDFLETLRTAVDSVKRRILKEYYFPQPPDFPITSAEPAYLKTAWLEIS